jgi:ribonuclease J
LSQSSVWAIPLGGLGEFGMNMLVVRTADDIIIIDAGLMFPEQELLGVDHLPEAEQAADPGHRSDACA